MQQSSTPIIDIHVHSTMKAYGCSKYENNPASIATNSSSLWFPDYRSRIDHIFEEILGISRFRQSDFTSLSNGQVKVACVSLYPVEKEFFNLKPTVLHPFEVILAQFASLFGKPRIREIRNPEFSYFDDLVKEYLFLTRDSIDQRHSRSYSVANNAAGLSDPANIHIIVTIEGCHAFCDGNDGTAPNAWKNMETRVQHVKNWDAAPFFVTLAHHFYNGLCTHAKSLFGKPGDLLDQSRGMREYGFQHTDQFAPISDEGWRLIKLLLQTNNGRRILIDVKHMSVEARTQYYAFLESYGEPVPVIWSHGAVAMGEKMQIQIDLDLDVTVIYKSEGLIGIEIDRRILGYHGPGTDMSGTPEFYQAAFVWRQIITLAEFAYAQGYTDNPWRCISIGSDFDGIINPLDNYCDANRMPVLYQYLIDYLEIYWRSNDPAIPKNGQDPTNIIFDIMYKNAWDFIQKHYQ